MALFRRVAAGPCVGMSVAGCAVSRGGDAESCGQAHTLAVAISWPRRLSAGGYARAALATPLGHDSGFSVLEARDIEAKELLDPLAHLVIRIHRDGFERGLTRTD